MSKILAIDYGLKRIGIAISDENRILAFALETISSSEIFSYLNQITIKENIDVFVIGKPIQKDNTPSNLESNIQQFINNLTKIYPQIKLDRCDERFTSVIAKKTIIDSGINRKKEEIKS